MKVQKVILRAQPSRGKQRGSDCFRKPSLGLDQAAKDY